MNAMNAEKLLKMAVEYASLAAEHLILSPQWSEAHEIEKPWVTPGNDEELVIQFIFPLLRGNHLKTVEWSRYLARSIQGAESLAAKPEHAEEKRLRWVSESAKKRESFRLNNARLEMEVEPLLTALQIEVLALDYFAWPANHPPTS